MKKTLYTGCQLMNEYCHPLRVKEENFPFLSLFCNRILEWHLGMKWKINKRKRSMFCII